MSISDLLREGGVPKPETNIALVAPGAAGTCFPLSTGTFVSEARDVFSCVPLSLRFYSESGLSKRIIGRQ